MLSAWTGTAIRAAEAAFLKAGLSGGPDDAALMQRAAAGLTAVIATRLRRHGRGTYGSRILVLAGGGNNGGDALYAGARLLARGAAVTAVLTSTHTHPSALAAFTGAGGRIVDLTDTAGAGEARVSDDVGHRYDHADAVVDGLVGTGAVGGLRGPAAALVGALACRPRPPLVIACDIPSGVDADTGVVAGPVLAADWTVTFAAAKTALMTDPGRQFAGRVRVVEIGVESTLPDPDVLRLEVDDVGRRWPVPAEDDHKYRRGVLGVVAGSDGLPGAALLATRAAVAAGAGMVRYLGSDEVAASVTGHSPEVVPCREGVDAAHVQAWLVGPGTGGDVDQRGRCAAALRTGLPAVADAEALAVLPKNPGPQVVLTPHAGELARLMSARSRSVSRGQIEAAPLAHVREASERLGATVLLKGPATLVAAPTGTVFSQAEGTAWLATAGSGDTLAGILGTLLAASPRPPARDADLVTGSADDHWAVLAAMAASVHGMAGRAAAGQQPGTAGQQPATAGRQPGTVGAPFGASDLARALPTALRVVLAASNDGGWTMGES